MKIKISFSFWLASLLLSVGQHYPLKVPDPPEVKDVLSISGSRKFHFVKGLSGPFSHLLEFSILTMETLHYVQKRQGTQIVSKSERNGQLACHRS